MNDCLTASQKSLTVQGRERTLTLVVPKNLPSDPPLVIVFHGSQQSSRVFRKFTAGTFDAAARNGAVLAYIDGFDRHFNDSRVGANFRCRELGIDDVAFTAATIKRLSRTHGIDESRVFVVGYSNGGHMVIRLIHEAPKLLAGAATIAATQPTPENFLLAGRLPTLPRPVRLLAIHGTEDQLAPYDGGQASLWGKQSRGAVLSAPDSARYFAERNGIRTPPTETQWHEDVVVTEWAGQDLEPVHLWTVHGMGHVVPVPHELPASLGPGTRAFTAADVITDFFGLSEV
ncbi:MULTISPECIES: alpha/beta hydrolase family esterase [Micrococcaceae]|uniref:alpha/beta hydrolase family esterase n=1 Tax=unclassified Kocuria TaxID=2649579 RepID=UPI001010FE15|nr:MULTISPECIES: PHB depolymerase family esterase [unclassified Kocuria]